MVIQYQCHQYLNSRTSSVGFEGDFDDNALLKRYKTRNLFRRDHGLLQKIESKLRHKLDIILQKFKQITIDIDMVLILVNYKNLMILRVF